MKKFVSLLLVLAMGLSLCSIAAAEADGKITIWTWDPTFNIAAMKVAKEMYQKDHPDVEIEIVEKLSEDIETAVIASNGDTSTLPDILLVQDNSFQKFVTNYPEVYADITGQYDLSEFAPGKVAYSTVDGKNYGIPFDAGTVTATYRTDYLEEAGYTIADLTDIDWDRFIEIGRDVKAKTGRPMLSGQAEAVDMILIMLQSCGASMFTEDGAVNFVNNEPLREVLSYYKQMVDEGIFIEVNTWDEYIGTISNQTVVGTMTGCWILSTIMSLPEQSGLWGLTNMPKLVASEGATNYSNNGGSSWAIINDKDFDLALDFMQIYRNVDFYSEILPMTSAIATYTPAKEGAAYTAGSDYFNGEPIFATIVEYGALTPSNITGAFYYDARRALATANTNYLHGGDLDSELQTAEDTVNFTMGF
ncbi:MAG: ABC transporter substrate-binding protein [Clostridia bacterium]|nr:ABC transporter substrate-binding protein [Clostridia bacterium]